MSPNTLSLCLLPHLLASIIVEIGQMIGIPELGCWCQRWAASKPKATYSSHQNLNLPGKAYCGQAQDGRSSRGRGERPGMTTFGWIDERKKPKWWWWTFPKPAHLSRWLANSDLFWRTRLGNHIAGGFNHLPDNALLMTILIGHWHLFVLEGLRVGWAISSHTK